MIVVDWFDGNVVDDDDVENEREKDTVGWRWLGGMEWHQPFITGTHIHIGIWHKCLSNRPLLWHKKLCTAVMVDDDVDVDVDVGVDLIVA